MIKISIRDEKSGRKFELTPIQHQKSRKKECSGLSDYIIASGATCQVFHAKDENGFRYLVKKFTSEADGERDSNIIKEIIDIYDKRGINYFLKDCFVGTDGTSVYHVFEQINGEIVKPVAPKTIKELLNVLNEYKSFLESLKILHRKGIIHCDIKPSNIFKFKANINDNYSLQIIDFGSIAREEQMVSSIIENGIDGYTYCGTDKWYSQKDIQKLCRLIQGGEENLEYVLDLTASVRVLCYMLCGSINSLCFNDTEIEKYLGICERLEYIHTRAVGTDITKRYLSCDDLIYDVDLIIESISGISKYPEALKIVSKNMLLRGTGNMVCKDKLVEELREEFNEIESKDCISVDELLAQINTDILPHINIEGTNYISVDRKNPLERVITKYKENIVLFGTGGGGKSTTLRHLYLSNIENNRKNYLYLSAKDFKHENLQSSDNKILSLLDARYNNCNVEKIIKNEKIKVYILFDAFDEVSDISYLQILNEIEELSKLNNQFVIASRVDAEKLKLFKEIKQGSFLKLTEEQIEKAIPEDVESIKKSPLYKLLHTPMLLTIFKKIQNLGSDVRKIKYPEDLIEEYLKRIHNKDKGNLYLFDKFISDISSYSVHQIDISDQRKYDEVEEYLKAGHVKHLLWLELHYSQNNTNGPNDTASYYKITFSHKLYEDYFKGCWLYDFFSNAISKKHIEVNDFYFSADLQVERDFSPYWVERLKNKIAPHAKNSSIYKELNTLISRFNKQDVKHSELSEKRSKSIKSFLQMLVLCCDGELVDTVKNKPLLELKGFQRHFMSAVDFDTVKSMYIPWYFNMYFNKGAFARRSNRKREKSLEREGLIQGNEVVGLINKLLSKRLVVSRWNLSCKSKDGSVYSKLGTRLLNASVPNADDGLFVIPKSVITIDKNAFQYCSCKGFLSKSIFFKSIDGILYNSITKSLVRYPTKKEQDRFELSIGRAVYPYAFARTENLKELNLERIWQKKIADSLMEFSSIERIAFPEKMRSIGKKAFFGCTSLKNMDTLMSARFVKEKAFYGCHSLTNLNFFKSVVSISWSAFKDCKTIEEFISSRSLKYIGMNAFEKTYNLKALWLEDSVKHIGIGAFDSCGAEREEDPNGVITALEYPDATIIRKDPYSTKKDNLFECVHEYDHAKYKKFYEKTKKSYSRSRVKSYATICNLAFCYEKGIGVPQDISKALQLYNEIWQKSDEYVQQRISSIKNTSY